MLDLRATDDVTSERNPSVYNLSTNDLPAMTMPLRRFFPAGEAQRAHPAALGSQGEMYDGREFWWKDAFGACKMVHVADAESISSKNGGVIASNVMLLSAFKHLQELWLQRRQSEVQWFVCAQEVHHSVACGASFLCTGTL
jgi:hypothetical protein